MDRLDELENGSIYLLREVRARLKKPALLWSAGKDSTCMIQLARKAFFGKVPFPVLHLDTGFKPPGIRRFRDRWARRWGLDLRVRWNEAAIRDGMSPERGRFECCAALKTDALKQALRELGLGALLLAIRRDEHGVRAKEREVSPRTGDCVWDYEDQPLELWGHHCSAPRGGGHLRVHPMLAWTELDVWRYIRRERLPVLPLYLARGGRRFRSVGCAPCCEPVPSAADTAAKIIAELRRTRSAERGGRAQDKEDPHHMAKLRALGYM